MLTGRAGRILGVATTFSEFEARGLGLEARRLRTEEDVTAIVTTAIETREDVRWLKQAVQALLDHAGVEPDDGADE
jgi:hypothetical protein